VSQFDSSMEVHFGTRALDDEYIGTHQVSQIDPVFVSVSLVRLAVSAWSDQTGWLVAQVSSSEL